MSWFLNKRTSDPRFAGGRVELESRTAITDWHSTSDRVAPPPQIQPQPSGLTLTHSTAAEKKRKKSDSDSESGNDETDGHRLNKIYRAKGGSKEFFVYVRDGGKVKKVSFGDPNMKNKNNNDERRKNFRARHNCEDKKDRTKAGYWACKYALKQPIGLRCCMKFSSSLRVLAGSGKRATRTHSAFAPSMAAIRCRLRAPSSSSSSSLGRTRRTSRSPPLGPS